MSKIKNALELFKESSVLKGLMTACVPIIINDEGACELSSVDTHLANPTLLHL